MKERSGFLHWVFPAMLAVVGLTALLSGRDLSHMFMELQEGSGVLHPAIPWAQRVVSIILLAASGERIVSHLAMHKHMPSPVLTIAFVAYWLTTVAAPAVTIGTKRRPPKNAR